MFAVGSDQRIMAYLLHAQAITRASAEWDKIPVHIWMNFAKPTIRIEFERLFIDRWVGMHVVAGHADRNLSGRISSHFSNKSSALSHSNRYSPFVVSNWYIRWAAGQSMHDSVAVTRYNVPWVSCSRIVRGHLRTYRKPSLMRAWRYGSLSNSARVGVCSG